jgi:hypothetical protein
MMSTMIPMVQRIEILSRNPAMSKMIPRMIMAVSLSVRHLPPREPDRSSGCSTLVSKAGCLCTLSEVVCAPEGAVSTPMNPMMAADPC